jgi:hypothetical protein
MDDGGEVHSRDFAGRPLKGDSEPAAGIHYDNMSAGSDGRSFDIRNGRGYRTEDYQRRRRGDSFSPFLLAWLQQFLFKKHVLSHDLYFACD